MSYDYLEFIKIALSVGAVGTIIKFVIDRVCSTGIEFDLENNYSRAFRELFNYLFSVMYLLLISIGIYAAFFQYEKQNDVDVVTSGHYSFTQKDMDKIDTLIKKENVKFAILAVVILIIYTIIIYGMIRRFWYRNYRRRFYVELSGKKFFIKKRLLKNKILVFDNKNVFRIIDFDSLNEIDLKQEDIKERNNKRYVEYYNNFNDMKKGNKHSKRSKILSIIFCILVVIFLTFLFYIQKEKLFFVGALLIMPSVTFLYYRYQYNRGKKLLEQTFFYSVKFLL